MNADATPPSIARLGEVEVDISARRLRRGGEVVELQEKPWRLLEALLERHGQVVPREELHRALWPGVEHLDFDANLHAAARKLRQALGDDASQPRWIETVPGQGYRLRLDPPRASARRSPTRLAVVGVAVALAIAGLWAFSSRSAAGRPTRLAIMPFELLWPDGAEKDQRRPAALSERILAETATRWPKRLEVVGPRSTASYSAAPFPYLRRLADELAIDYVLNGRPIEGEGDQLELLVELIRLPDGAHVYVERFPGTASNAGIEVAVRDGVADALALPEH